MEGENTMEDNKKYELNDKDLDEVAGGYWRDEDLSNYGEYVGDEEMHCRYCNGYTGTTPHMVYQDGAFKIAQCKSCGNRVKSSTPRIIFDINTA